MNLLDSPWIERVNWWTALKIVQLLLTERVKT